MRSFGWVVAFAAIVLVLAGGAVLMFHPLEATSSVEAAPVVHHVVIEVSDDDPKSMNLALNNAENLTNYYRNLDQRVEIEFVALGPGLKMVRSDDSPVGKRLATFKRDYNNITFSGCGNTLEKQSRAEGRQISLLPEARVVSSGIERIVELEERGWTYVRP